MKSYIVINLGDFK